MQDLEYQTLKRFRKVKKSTKQNIWLYIWGTQVVPLPDHKEFDAAFIELEKGKLIDWDVQLDALKEREYVFTKWGAIAYRKETKIRRKPFQQKLWWLWPILALAAGFWLDIGKEAMRRKLWPESNQTLPIVQPKTDTLMKRR